MVNTGDEPVTWAIWDITQVPSKAKVVVPLSGGATYRTKTGEPLSDRWRRAADALILEPTDEGEGEKVFVSGPPGWLACSPGEWLFLTSFRIAAQATPPSEAPREVWTGTRGYTELELVGPEVSLQPGEEVRMRQTWELFPVEPMRSDADLVRYAREAAGIRAAE
jgi:hypothetical protein